MPGSWYWTLRVHVEPGQLRGWDGRDRVDLGSQLSERTQMYGRVCFAAQVGDFNRHERPAAKRLRDVGQRRQVQEAAARGQLCGAGAGPGTPCVEYRLGLLHGPEQRPGVDLGDGKELELQCGHDAEGAPAAAHSPEQVRLVIVVGAHEAAVRQDEFDGEDAVGGQAVTAAEPADAAS